MFDALTTPSPPGTTWTLDVPDGWQQGRGAFGGFLTAAMIRVLEKSNTSRPLRSLTAEFFAPVVTGGAQLTHEVLRAGNAMTTSTVRLLQDGEVCAHAVGVLGSSRVNDRDQVRLEKPVMKPWRECEVLPVEAPMGPVFAQHVEFRPTGPMPFSGAKEPVTEGWVRFKQQGEKRDAALLAAIADTYWPALFLLEEMPRPMATVAFTFQPFANFQGLAPEAPFFIRAKLAAADAGYTVEFREVWGEDGRLLALNQQTFVIIK
ncbi:MAG: thioesterase family protein [Archangium sp.]|nr:thioesterase family protein [Archangium sp.]